MKAELAQLIAIQNTDNTIRRLTEDIAAIPERRADIEKEFDERASQIKEVESARDAAQSERRRIENEVEEAKGRVERAERNLMASKKQDEYQASLREADANRKQIGKLEEEVLKQMEAIEQAENSLQERAPELERLRGEMQARIAELDAQIAREEAELDAANQERARFGKELSPATLATYNRIVKRVRDGIAVVEARNNACTACRMAIRPQVMASIRRGDEVITCENCIRILYYVPADNAVSSQTTIAKPIGIDSI